jgi:hypothetical protein
VATIFRINRGLRIHFAACSSGGTGKVQPQGLSGEFEMKSDQMEPDPPYTQAACCKRFIMNPKSPDRH